MRTLPLLTLSLLLIPVLTVAAQAPDEVGLVRIDPDDKKEKKLWIALNAPSAAPGEILGELRATDGKWEKVGGKTPLRFSFAAQWDAEGYEEIVAIREHKKKKDKRLELLVYRAPTAVNGNTGKPVASTRKATFGVAKGDGRVVAVGPIDLEGDHRDEVAVVREALDGVQSLEILTLPTKKKDKGVTLLRSDATFGHAETDAVVGLYGTDLDGDGSEELVVLRRDGAGVESLEVVTPPAGPLGEAGAPIVSDEDVTPPAGWSTRTIARLRADGGNLYRALLLREHEDGAQRLEHYELPGTLNGDVGAALDVDEDLAIAGFESSILSAFGVRPTPEPPEPHEPFSGKWQVWFLFAYQDQGATIHHEWTGPFTGITGTSTETDYLTLQFPAGTTWDTDTVEGYVSAFGDGETAYFKLPGFPYGPQIHFYPTVGKGLAVPGDRITVSYPFGSIHQADPFSLPTIDAGFAGGTSIGEVVADDNVTLKAVVQAYRFERVP